MNGLPQSLCGFAGDHLTTTDEISINPHSHLWHSCLRPVRQTCQTGARAHANADAGRETISVGAAE